MQIPENMSDQGFRHLLRNLFPGARQGIDLSMLLLSKTG